MSNKLKVIQILPELNGGGVERGTLELAEALVAAGHRSLVISNGGRLVPELEAGGSQHIQLAVHKKRPSSLSKVFALKRIFLEQKPDVIHLRSRLPAWLAWLACKTLPAAQRPIIVTTVHGLNSVNRYSKIMTAGDAVIAVSQTVMDYIAQHYPDRFGSHCHLIYRGIDPAAFNYGYQPKQEWLQSWYHQYPQLKGEKVLCLPGRITRLKGHHDFLDLLASLHQRGQKVYGLIVGGEDPRRLGYFRELKQKVEQAGLSDWVIFTGHRSDIKEIYSVSDLIFSLSTKPESFGRTVLEPLAMGRMVIGYNHGGVGEILTRLFPEGRVALSDAQQLLARTGELLGEPVKPRQDNPFLLSEMTGKTIALYQSLVREKARH